MSSTRERLLKLYQHPCVQNGKGVACRSLFQGKELSQQYFKKGMDMSKKYTQVVHDTWKSSPLYGHKYVVNARNMGSQYWDVAQEQGKKLANVGKQVWSNVDTYASKEVSNLQHLLKEKSKVYGSLAKEKSHVLLASSQLYGSKYGSIFVYQLLSILSKIEQFMLGPVRNWFLVSKYLFREIIRQQELGPPTISQWAQAKTIYQQSLNTLLTHSVLDYTWGQVLRVLKLGIELFGFYYIGSFVGTGLRKAVST
jgi:hypothetical protein